MNRSIPDFSKERTSLTMIVKSVKKRLLAALLLAATLWGSTACTQNPDDPLDTAASDTGSDTSTVTSAATTLETSDTKPAETDGGGSVWEPVAGANVTELSIPNTVAGTGTSTDTVATVTLAYAVGDAAYSLKEADGEGSKVTLHNSTVSALRLSTVFNDDTVARYEGTVQVNSDATQSAWCSLYIGLRLSEPSADPTSQSGIWIALKSDKIGIRTDAWPTTSLTPIKPSGVDFSTARKLYIEDDMKTDVITLWADNDAGEKVELATVKLENDRIQFYHPGDDRPTFSDPILKAINGNGCFSLWLHHVKNPAVITDWKSTGAVSPKFTAPDGNLMLGRDILSDTWVSIDDEGRVAGTDNGVVNDKKVGIFYFLWHNGTSFQPIYNHAEAYEKGGSALLIETIKSGPLGFAHYWAEPYFGYYQSNDEWVIRKHTYQLNAAGVDFVFIDATNGHTYENNYETILKVWSEMRAEGHTTPQIMFHCGNTYNLAKASFTDLWDNLYSQGRYEELWFKWQGKPLVLLPHALYKDLTAKQQEFINYRQSWARTADAWYTDTRGKGAWAWADMYPQRPGLSHEGEKEQMIVMCGFWVNGSYGTNAGRSYSKNNGGQPTPDTADDFSFSLVDKTSGKGIAFQEQFDFAIERDPSLIMITGWNEWWAGRWEAGGATGQTIANTYKVTNDNNWTRNYFVDCFNPEYSRDIEPVKGYFNDNYYYQMVQNIRAYKGSRVPLSAFGQRPIDMAADVSQWDIVGPEFRDFTGDVTHRNHMSYVGQILYTNTSGRNDFTVAKVSRFGDDVWFYAACASDITAPEGTNWMNLYLDADADPTTGWNGYEYIINRTQSGDTCSIQKFVGGAWAFEDVGNATLSVSGNVIQIRVSATALGLGETFDFKWADNSVDDGRIMQFLDLGDTAPDGRFNYRYTTKAVEPSMPAVMTSDITVLKAGSYYAYDGGELVRLDETTTKATFLGDTEHLYLPLAFARDTLGLDVASAKTYNHYGVAYVDVAAALSTCGKTVNRADGLIVLADKAFTEEEMLTIYRAMY